ncbi:enoyl-CoA hydratase-related protein [Desulforhopalus singaporensis]|uniref:Short chain enoyl-CoA hydratase n=1 Tax=Desulforhopalus singaporensis TaxID=91360 RepID=A0A1H0V2I6_9BACT|nr:enoyl-CoA hydratase-related protein [Desulforhopalus singaporensis]SDP72266.1 short chain enoyl-CoA hydratase [Desulforhopalus singaporensis]
MSTIITEFPVSGVTLIRINRPEVRNALNLEVRRELAELFDKMTNDADVRCVVLTGNEKAFAAGADIAEMMDAGTIEMMSRGIHKLLKPIAEFSKPLIAAVNGYALGGGCELAMHADIIIAGENAQFGLPEVRLGVMPGGGGTQRLIRAVGKFKAMKMLLTGDFVSAREANTMGLVSEVVPDADVEGRAIEMASQIASYATLGLAQIKEVITAGQDLSLESALMLERKALQLLFASQDKKEGMRAFLEKRKPVFQGK